MIGSRQAASLVGLALLAFGAQPAAGHMQVSVGSFVDLVQRSDLVVVGEVRACDAQASKSYRLVLLPAAAILGSAPTPVAEPAPLSVISDGRFEPGMRGVFFLRRDGEAFRALQMPGAIYDAAPAADGSYRAAVTGVRQSLAIDDEAARIASLRTVLITALTSPAEALRYHALLDLLATVHPDHPLTSAQQQLLREAMAQPGFDPQLRAVIDRAVPQTPSGRGN